MLYFNGCGLTAVTFIPLICAATESGGMETFMRKYAALLTIPVLVLSISFSSFPIYTEAKELSDAEALGSTSYDSEAISDVSDDADSIIPESDALISNAENSVFSDIEMSNITATSDTSSATASDIYASSEIAGEDKSAADSETSYEVVYRMYNPNSSEHFYTAEQSERLALYMAGWDAEDIGWIAPKTSSVPIYRMYNGLEHHYTTDMNEVNHLTSIGWTNEGIAFYSNDSYTTVPMYRLFNPNSTGVGAHHYTDNAAERSLLISYGWRDEGIAWYNLNVNKSSITIPTLPERYEHNIKNTESYATIEADVKVGGNGSGTHAKLVFQTPTAAVSFGIQYDRWARAPYTDTTFFLCENVSSNAEGGQTYLYYDNTERNIWQHLMMTYEKNGTLTLYVGGQKVGQVWNPYLSKDDLYCSVEGSGRLDGDYIEAGFRNVKVKSGGVYNESKIWPTYNIITNDGLQITKTGFDTANPAGAITISGTISDLNGQDWDSAYGRVSGVVHIGDAL